MNLPVDEVLQLGEAASDALRWKDSVTLWETEGYPATYAAFVLMIFTLDAAAEPIPGSNLRAGLAYGPEAESLLPMGDLQRARECQSECLRLVARASQAIGRDKADPLIEARLRNLSSEFGASSLYMLSTIANNHVAKVDASKAVTIWQAVEERMRGMNELDEGSVPAARAVALDGDSDGKELPLPPGDVTYVPVPTPKGNGQARPLAVTGAWGAVAVVTQFRDADPAVPLSYALGWEQPFTPFGLPPMSERSAERLQVDLFIKDWWAAHSAPPFVVVSQDERPDFQVQFETHRSGLEVTRFATPRRRVAIHHLNLLRQSILASPQSYRHLEDHTVTVWFSNDGIPGSGLPPRINQVTERDAVLEHLATLDPANLPGHLQEVAGAIGSGTSLQRFSQVRPGSHFYAECGLELAIAYSTHHTTQDVWLELARVARKHDYPGADRLLISVAAPVEPKGEVWPGDHVLWTLASEASPEWPDRPLLQHIRRVFVHDWWDGSIRRIYPDSDEVSPPQRFSPTYPVRRGRHGDVMGWSPIPTTR